MVLFTACNQETEGEDTDDGGSSPTLYSIVATGGPFTADGADPATITITLKDSNGTALPGETPTFEATGSNNSYGVCSVTDALGVSTCSMTSTTAETKRLSITSPVSFTGGKVTFVGGSATTVTFTSTISSVQFAGSSFFDAPAVEVTDAFGNLATTSTEQVEINLYDDASCTTLSATTLTVDTNPITLDGTSGTATFSNALATIAGTYYLGVDSPSNGAITDDCQGPFVISPNSNLELAFTTEPALTGDPGVPFTTQPVNVLQDEYGNLVATTSGFSVEMNAYSDSSCTTLAGGSLGGTTTESIVSGIVNTWNLNYTSSGTIYLGASFSGTGVTSACSTAITLGASSVDAGNSTIVGTGPVDADGVSTSTITITLLDAANVGQSGIIPTFSATDTGGDNIYGTCSASDASGISTCTLASLTAETKNLTITSPITDLGSAVIFLALPAIEITSVTEGGFLNSTEDSATYTVSGTCNNGSSDTASILIDGLAASSPSGFSCDGTNFTGTIDTTGIAEGAFTIQAEIDDESGGTVTSTIFNLTKDTIVPTITLNAVADINIANEASLPISGTCSEDTRDVSVDIDGTVFTLTCTGGAFSGNIDTSPVGDGTLLSVAADHADEAGNSATQATDTIDKDATAPTIAITFSSDINSSNESTYQVSGTCSDDGQTISLSIGGILDSPTCSSGSWTSSITDVSGLVDGSITITADINDALGNSATQASVSVTKSSATPTVAITSAPDITQANETGYEVSGTCSENGRTVTIDLGGTAYTPSCSGGTWTTGSQDVSALLDGSVVITADHDNSGGTPATQASVTVSKDTTAPTVTISSAPDITSSNETSYTVSGTCSENGENVDIAIDVDSYTVVCGSNTWTTGSVDVSGLSDGSISITADHQNSGGTPATQASVTVNKNSSSPVPFDLSVGQTLSDSADLTWKISNPGGFTINDYQIEYRVKGSTTYLVFSDSVSTDEFVTVDGLLADTTYEFRVLAIYDSSFNSDYSNTAEGTTQPASSVITANSVMNLGGATSSVVAAHFDSTTITLNGGALTTLNAGETFAFSSAQFDIVDADKPVFVAGLRGSGSGATGANIAWNPTSWASKDFSFNSTRDNPQEVYIYAIEDASIEVRQGSTVLTSATLTADTTTTLSWSVFGSYQVVSTGSILAFHISTGSSRVTDPKPLTPSYTEIIGFPSNSMRLTTTVDSTNYTYYHSDSTTASGSLNKSDSIQIDPEGGTTSLYQSESLLIQADQEISGASFADSNGNCAAAFLPTNLMRNRFVVPVQTEYIAFASLNSGTIEVYDSSDILIDTLTLTRSGSESSAPYHVRGTNYAAGSRFIADVPVAAWYQPDTTTNAGNDDETLLYGTNETP